MKKHNKINVDFSTFFVVFILLSISTQWNVFRRFKTIFIVWNIVCEIFHTFVSYFISFTIFFFVLLLVNDNHAKSFVYKFHFIVITCIFLKVDRVRKDKSKFWKIIKFEKCIIADIRFIFRRDVFIWREWWWKATKFETTFHTIIFSEEKQKFFLCET